MDNYSKVLTFFMENGVQLNKEQMEALKEEFLEEKATSGAINKLYYNRAKEYNNLVRTADKKEEIGTPARKKEAKDLKDKAEEILNKPLSGKEYETYDGYRCKPTTRDADWHKEYDEGLKDAFKYLPEERKHNAHAIKTVLGQGKENMPKDREPGEYLKKQELINKYEKDEK